MTNIKHIAIIALLYSCLMNSYAQNLYPNPDKRADTLEINHIHLKMDMRNIASRKLKGKASLNLKVKINGTNKIRVDLEGLAIDSITIENQNAIYTKDQKSILIMLPKLYNQGDSIKMDIYYGGTPKTDASGFGGFYFSKDYAYAIGVGFLADPHPFGRSWFPCFDNFIMKSTYSFEIITDTGFAAICGGTLLSKTVNNNTIEWKYSLSQPIPSYLVSLAVSKYELLEENIVSKSGNIPSILAAEAKDTANLRKSFVNFPAAVNAFEHYFGPYYWDRLGYHAVPFNGGAMEHACNISYPLFAIDGSTSREDLMAHELAHHWWGNNITCKTQEDMWINEGWASYSEKLFNEYVYGPAAYRQKVEETHREVLQFAHIADGQILPVSGISHANTYGRHVYKKGSDIAHTLRGYMGDSAFFGAIKYLMEKKKFGNMDSKELIDSFQQFTPIPLQSFYQGWVIGAGFPHLDVKTWKTQKIGNEFHTNVGILQRTRWDLPPHELIPVEVTLMGANFNTLTQQVLATKFQSNFTIITSFEPKWVGVDLYQKLNDATTDTFRFINTKGNYNFEDGLMQVSVNEIDKPIFLRITHNWLHADRSTQVGLLPILSTQRYWSVSGIFDPSFKAKATLNYNGQTIGLNGDNYLDNQLIKTTEDSLTLMFREDMYSTWVVADATFVTGNKIDRKGSVVINNLQSGEYALAIYRQSLGNESDLEKQAMNVYPNPARDNVFISFSAFTKPGFIIITDSLGKLMIKKPIRNTQNNFDIDTKEWAAGKYTILLQYPDGGQSSESFVIVR